MDDDKKGVYIFGRDVSQIPCYRESLLWGFGGGFSGGLGYFLFTSNVRMASHVGMGSFMATTLIYWFRCRYIYFQQKHDMLKIQAQLEKRLFSPTPSQIPLDTDEFTKPPKFDVKTV